MIRRLFSRIADYAATVTVYLFPVFFPHSLDGPTERAEQRHRAEEADFEE